MGMYTELIIKADVKNNLPDDVEQVLQYLFNGGDEPDSLPDHLFFRCERWPMVGQCSSYYHTPWATSKYSEGYLFSRSDLKNYGDEISLFIDWIKPYLDVYEGQCIGWRWYEEDDVPVLIII
jgi:hypothetical protein